MKMNQDKDCALKEALRKSSSGNLPFNFTDRMIMRINAEAEKKQKRAYVLNICILSFVSALLIGFVVFALTTFCSFNLVESLQRIKFSSDSLQIFGFYFYIAFLVLGLLGLDYWLRKLKQRL